MSEEVADLRELADTLAGLAYEATAVRQALRRRIASSPGAWPMGFDLSRLQLDYRLAMAREEDRTVFFFRRRRDSVVSFRADVRLSLGPSATDAPVYGARDRVIEVRLPSFAHSTPPAKLQAMETQLGVQLDSDDVLGWHLGPGETVYAIRPARGGSALLLEDAAGTFSLLAGDSPLPAGPMWQLARSVEAWVEERGPVGRSQQLPRTSLDASRSDLEETLLSFLYVHDRLEGYLRFEPSLGNAPPTRLKEFRADVRLRVNRDGDLAKPGEDDSIEVALDISMPEDAADSPTIVGLRPPDFVPSETLREAIRRALLRPGEHRERLAEALDPPGPDSGRADRAEHLIRSAFHDGTALLFRTGRKAESGSGRPLDTYVVMLEGEVDGQRIQRAIRVRLRVIDTLAGPLVTLRRVWRKPLYPHQGGMHPDFAAYFLRLATALLEWLRLVPEA